jgi:hypothetical protein
VSKASLYHLAVVACLILAVVLAFAQLVPDSNFDGAD